MNGILPNLLRKRRNSIILVEIVFLKFLQSPTLPVEVSVIDGFGEMAGLDVFGGIKVGNGAGDFQDTVVGTGGQAQTLHGGFEQGQTGGIGHGIFMQKRRSHLGVAIDTFIIGKTLFLDSTRLDNPFTDSQTGFGRTLFGNLLKRHGNDLHLYVDTVEQRSRNTVHVFLHRSRRTKTRPVGMVVITARARIHRSDQHKAGRIIDRETGTRNRDLAILQRLTHHFEHTSVELRQLNIKKSLA